MPNPEATPQRLLPEGVSLEEIQELLDEARFLQVEEQANKIMEDFTLTFEDKALELKKLIENTPNPMVARLTAQLDAFSENTTDEESTNE